MAPTGEPSRPAITGNCGRATAGSRVASNGTTSAAYSSAGPATTSGLRSSRVVSRAPGTKTIRAQNGRTVRPPSSNTYRTTFSITHLRR